MKSPRLAGVVSAVVVATLMAGVEIRAATNNDGGVLPASVYCDPDDIIVQVPVIQPARVQYNDPGFNVGSTSQIPSQVVAFRANLAFWDGTKWLTYREGSWFWQEAKFAGSFLTGLSPWYSWDTGQVLTSDPRFFDLPNSGNYDLPYYYAVYYRYWWKADKYRDEGRSWGWAASHEDNRGQPLGTAIYGQDPKQWCKYPGPNWLLDLN